MTAPLKFEFALDAAETVRAGQEIEKRARGGRLQAVLMLLFAAPLTVGIVRGAPSKFYAVYFGILVGILLLTLIWPAIRERQVQKFYDASPAFRGIQRYEFADEGLGLSNDQASNLVRWTAFTQAIETPEFFLLYYSPKCAYYLPKRVVETESQADAIRRLLRDKLRERERESRVPRGAHITNAEANKRSVDLLRLRRNSYLTRLQLS